jgi:hypothetical protein
MIPEDIKKMLVLRKEELQIPSYLSGLLPPQQVVRLTSTEVSHRISSAIEASRGAG